MISGFCSSDVVEAAQADMIFEASSDLRIHLMKQFLETDEAKKVANCTVVVTKHLFSTVCDIPEKKKKGCGRPSSVIYVHCIIDVIKTEGHGSRIHWQLNWGARMED